MRVTIGDDIPRELLDEVKQWLSLHVSEPMHVLNWHSGDGKWKIEQHLFITRGIITTTVEFHDVAPELITLFTLRFVDESSIRNTSEVSWI